VLFNNGPGFREKKKKKRRDFMDIIGLIIVVLIASILQVGTGFGFSVIATPFLFLLFKPHDAIQLNIMLSLLISILIFYKIHNDVNKKILARLIKGSLFGLLPGLFFFLHFDVRMLKILVSILILVSTGFLVAKVKIKQTRLKDLIAGALSGLLTVSIGIPGPPLVIYFAGADMDKTTARSTILSYFMFIYFISLLLQLSTYKLSTDVWKAIKWAIPFTLLGMYLGQILFTRLNQELFQKLTYILLFITGSYLLMVSL